MRTTYRLLHGTETLLCLDLATTLPFLIGEIVEPYNEATGEVLGPYSVVEVARRIPFRARPEREPSRAALAGQEFIVHLQPLARQEDL